jgi:hypothetical protein
MPSRGSTGADGLTVAQLIAALLTVMKGERRSAVLGAQETLQRNGSVAPAIATMLRGLYRSNVSKIREVEAARERARVTMALERNGSSRDSLESEQDRKATVAAIRKTDLGF